MEKILVFNAGSSSLKYKAFDLTGKSVADGVVERIGIENGVITHNVVGFDKVKLENQNFPTHNEAIKLVLELLLHGDNKVINDFSEIKAVGHRVVHGGEVFTKSVAISYEVEAEIERCIKLAPLHNPANLNVIRAVKEILGKEILQVAVFDTAFHQTMKPEQYIYPLPYKYYEMYKIRKYGFHGISHRYINKRFSEINGNPEHLKLITCHLGNGASIAAIKDGNVIDTSMGFTPLDGLEMGTRSGELDPEILLYFMKKFEFGINQVEEIINKKSGLLGLSGISSDFRDVEKAASEGHVRAKMAIDRYITKIVGVIGSYISALNGVDGIVFTAGVGENSVFVREAVISTFEWFGIKLDKKANNVRGKERVITTKDSSVKVMIIPTEEELMIFNDVLEILNHNKGEAK